MAEIRIYDEIGYPGITAADVANTIAGLGPSTPLDIRISSDGGSLTEGIAIHSVIARHPGRTTAYIDSVAASAASFIAMSADEIIISPVGHMMIHDAWTVTAGSAREMTDVAAILNQLSASVAQIYARRAGGTAQQWRQAMLAETWYDADAAVAAGLADRVDPNFARTSNPTNAAHRQRTVAVAAARRRRAARSLAQKG